MSERGQRGKSVEKTVEDVLKLWNNRSSFAFHRLPDSRAARNFLVANPADFIYSCGHNVGFIEAKDTKHSYRVAKDKISQLATLKKFEMAGSRSVILIHHSAEDVWRALRPSHLEFGVPSWDLRDHPIYATADEALLSTGLFGDIDVR